jgi:hypothetical protein
LIGQRYGVGMCQKVDLGLEFIDILVERSGVDGLLSEFLLNFSQLISVSFI